jgi:hypothetical protein
MVKYLLFDSQGHFLACFSTEVLIEQWLGGRQEIWMRRENTLIPNTVFVGSYYVTILHTDSVNDDAIDYYSCEIKKFEVI